MPNKKTPLLCALICLSVTFPMLSGCRITGPAYKMSSWQFYNPFSSKSKNKDYDEFALAQQFDEPSINLPKQDVPPPREGYTVNPRETNKVAASSTNRTGRNASSDPLNDLHTAGLAQNSGATGFSSGIPSAQSRPGDTMFAQNGTPAGATTGIPSYGTTTPIDQGLGVASMNQMAAQQPQNANSAFGAYPASGQQPGYPAYQADPNAGMVPGFYANQPAANPGQPFGQPGYGQPDYGQSGFGQQPGQQFAVPGQPLPQNQTSYPGQPANMIVQSTDQPQASFAGTGDSQYGGFSNPGVAMSPNSTQMVASTQGMYGGQSFGAADPTYGNPAQTAMPQGATPTVGNAQQPMTSPNGQGASDPGYGVNNYSNPAGTGMSNPAAVGTPGYPMTDPAYSAIQPSPQATPTYFPGQSYQTQQPANNGYQNGFNYFGPTYDDGYRPGGM